MKKSLRMLISIVVITQVLLLLTGCGNNSLTGKYCRDFGNYTSSTMYIELKNNKTFETDGTAPGLFLKGTYEISGSNITFTSQIDSVLATALGTSEIIVTGTISGGKIKIEGVTYVK